MKRITLLYLAVLFAGAPSLPAQGSKDAVAADPVHHQVLFENDRVRVFEALASAGAKSPMHTHPPMALVSLSKARLRMAMDDGSSTIFDLNPAQALWIPGIEHSWELLAGKLHVIAVEVKGASGAGFVSLNRSGILGLRAIVQPSVERRFGRVDS